MKKSTLFRSLLSFIMIFAVLFSTGCRPYQTTVYEEIQNNESAYVVPLEDGSGAGEKFESVAYLEKLKVAAKRIQIPTRWQQTGRLWFQGSYIPMARVVKVARTPVVDQWIVKQDTNPDENIVEDNSAIWLESHDGIKFAMGFNCSASILETDTSLFLYNYKGDDLRKVLESETKARYQQTANAVAGKYNMDELKGKKDLIVDAVVADVVPFFKAKGITITTVGQFGGFTYRDKRISVKLEEVYIAQQEKQINLAKLDAQGDANKRIELAAKADANATLTKAEGEAKGKLSLAEAQAKGNLLVAEAEAKSVGLVTEALKASANNPAVLELRKIEALKEVGKQWKGELPNFLIIGGSGTNAGPGLLFDTRKQ